MNNTSGGFNKARDCAYRLLSYRPSSKKEIIDKLTTKGFNRKTVSEVVNYLTQLNYINDVEFARMWAETRISIKPMGLSLLKQELRNKGISSEIIDETIDEVGKSYNEYKIAKNLFLSRSKLYSHLDKTTSRRRIYGYLKRKWFSQGVISKLMQKRSSDNDD